MHNDRGLLQLIIVAKLPKLDRQAGDMVAYDPANQTRLNSLARIYICQSNRPARPVYVVYVYTDVFPLVTSTAMTSAELEMEARSPKSAAKRNAKVLATWPLICVQKKVQKRARVASTPASYWVTKDAGRVAASFDHEDEGVKLAAPLPVAHGPGGAYVLRLTEVRADDDHDYKLAEARDCAQDARRGGCRAAR